MFTAVSHLKKKRHTFSKYIIDNLYILPICAFTCPIEKVDTAFTTDVES